MQELLLVSRVYYYPIAAVVSYHKLNDLKEHKLLFFGSGGE